MSSQITSMMIMRADKVQTASQTLYKQFTNLQILMTCPQMGSQEFNFGGYKWVKETKQPHKKIKVD